MNPSHLAVQSSFRYLGLIVCSVFIAMALPGYSSIIANFSDGNTSSLVDGYTGMAGNGWKGAWQTYVTSAASYTSATVTNTNPFSSSSGNYLSLTLASAGNGSASQGAVARQYGASGSGVSLTSAAKFEFTFRAETVSSSSRYYIFDSPTGQTGTGSNASWQIVASGSNWIVTNGGGNGGTNTDITVQGISVVADVSYTFSIIADPTSKTWSVSISNDSNTVTMNDLNFRTTTAALGGYLNFGVQNLSASTADSFTYSIDSISISSVPEPRTASLFVGAVLLCAVSAAHARRVKAL